MNARRLLPLACLAALGCSPFDLHHLAPLEDAIVGVDDQHWVARVVRVDTDPVQTTEILLAEGTAQLHPRPGAPGELAIFTEGTLGDADEPPIPSEVVLVDRTGERQRWTLGRQYRSAAISPDGRWLYATAPWGRLVVENDVEVIDLSQPPSAANPFSLSLRSLGGEVPTAAAFSDAIPWTDGRPLRLVALFAFGQLSLFDLDAPDAPPVTIPTTVDATAVGPAPVEALFVGSELVVRTQTGSQLLVVALTESDGGAQRFDVALRTLAASGPVRSLAVDRRSTTPRLVALTSSALHVYDLATSLETSIPTSAVYTSILEFEGPAPGDPAMRPRLVLWGESPNLTFVDLGEEASSVIDATRIPLSFTPVDVVADGAAGRLIAFVRRDGASSLDVGGSSGRAPAAVIDLHDRSALALTTTIDVNRAVVSSDLADVWVATRDGYVNRFEIGSRAQEESWLDERVATLLPLFGTGRRVLAFHEVASGRFSILEPGGAEARRVDGVF